jgi:hypothetical protein
MISRSQKKKQKKGKEELYDQFFIDGLKIHFWPSFFCFEERVTGEHPGQITKDTDVEYRVTKDKDGLCE